MEQWTGRGAMAPFYYAFFMVHGGQGPCTAGYAAALGALAAGGGGHPWTPPPKVKRWSSY